jgi:hypothetical protein
MSQSAEADPEVPLDDEGDDRVLVTGGEGDRDVWVSSSWNSSGSAYHTRKCTMYARMESPKDVTESLAEWKGYDECRMCQELRARERLDELDVGPTRTEQSRLDDHAEGGDA